MRYQYTSPGFKKEFNNHLLFTPLGVKILLIINISVFLLMELSGNKNLLFHIFGLVPLSIAQEFKIWQTITYLFIHGGYLHIIFNMFVLWMFGRDLENNWGLNQFIFFYFLCGIFSGLTNVLLNIHSPIPVVGASGAIYGLIVAYGFTYPNRTIYLYGIFPLKVKYIVVGLGTIAFFASFSAKQSSISHITHLSGMCIATAYILYSKKNKLQLWFYKKKLSSIVKTQNIKNKQEDIMKIQVDKILDKINVNGWDSLTKEEEQTLTNASKKYFNNYPPN